VSDKLSRKKLEEFIDRLIADNDETIEDDLDGDSNSRVENETLDNIKFFIRQGIFNSEE